MSLEEITKKGGCVLDSILTSIKKLLGISEEYTHFDMDLVIHINTIFGSLTQMGIGPDTGFIITDKNDTWDDFLSQDPNGSLGLLESVKTYMYLKVKNIFDPATNASTTEAFNKIAEEIEWRMMNVYKAEVNDDV